MAGMKVLHIYSGNLFGGIETLLLALARYRGLTPEMQPSFALCFDEELSARLAEAGTPPLILGDVRVRKPWTVIRAREALARHLERDRPGVVICHAPWAYAIFGKPAFDAGVPVLLWQHDVARGTHWVERWAKRRVPRLVISNSLFSQSTLPRLFDPVQSEVLYCPVTPPAPRPWQEERAPIRARLAIPESATVIVQASRMEAWKGHRLHLEALARLADIPDWVSLQIGGPQRPHEEVYYNQMKKLAKSLGIADRVRFVGQRSDVQALLAASDIHCQPNLSPEPFGIAFIEALYAGLPVVTTRLGGALEIIGQDTGAGVLVDPDSPSSLAAALRPLLLDPSARASFRLNGPRRARELCDPALRLGQLSRLCARVGKV